MIWFSLYSYCRFISIICFCLGVWLLVNSAPRFDLCSAAVVEVGCKQESADMSTPKGERLPIDVAENDGDLFLAVSDSPLFGFTGDASRVPG